MQDLIIDIVVPTEDRVEVKDGQRKIKTKKIFPGYVIIKMIVTNESWYLVRNTQGVTGFVGHGSEPIPLTDEEVARMGIEKVYIDLFFLVDLLNCAHEAFKWPAYDAYRFSHFYIQVDVYFFYPHPGDFLVSQRNRL